MRIPRDTKKKVNTHTQTHRQLASNPVPHIVCCHDTVSLSFCRFFGYKKRTFCSTLRFLFLFTCVISSSSNCFLCSPLCHSHSQTILWSSFPSLLFIPFHFGAKLFACANFGLSFGMVAIVLTSVSAAAATAASSSSSSSTTFKCYKCCPNGCWMLHSFCVECVPHILQWCVYCTDDSCAKWNSHSVLTGFETLSLFLLSISFRLLLSVFALCAFHPVPVRLFFFRFFFHFVVSALPLESTWVLHADATRATVSSILLCLSCHKTLLWMFARACELN